MREYHPLTGQTAPAEEASERQAFADDVRYYLSLQPRQLPSRYFYDAVGSALFEAICRLPWYPVTRAETRLIERHAHGIVGHLDPLSTVIELGPGSGEKLALLVESGRTRPEPLTVHLVDVSPTALASAAQVLSRLDATTVLTHQTDYESGLAQVASGPRAGGRALVLFLGSNIGNFDPPGAAAFLRGIRSSLMNDDALLNGTDLVKSERELVLAYDDPLGVTAAFNRNLLVRINRDLDGDFDLDAFSHRALWNADASRMEMHLVCRRRQRVNIRAAGLVLALEEGESIWTESSYKYLPETVHGMLERAGFAVVEQWLDDEHGFALTLSAPLGTPA
jgi:L-histidine N-alpha-methyltransferase